MKGNEVKKIAKMFIDSYIKDDSEYHTDFKGFELHTSLHCHKIDHEDDEQ